MHKLAHILRLGIKELTSLRHDSVLLLFLFYAFTVAIYMPAAARPARISGWSSARRKASDKAVTRASGVPAGA